MSAARDRLGGGRHQAQQHVGDPVPLRPGLAGPDKVESARPVVEQGWAGKPARPRDAWEALEPRRADRVSPGTATARQPGGEAEVSGGEVGAEQVNAPADR